MVCFLNLEKPQSWRRVRNAALWQVGIVKRPLGSAAQGVPGELGWNQLHRCLRVLSLLGVRTPALSGPDGPLSVSYEIHRTLVASPSSIRDRGFPCQLSC